MNVKPLIALLNYFTCYSNFRPFSPGLLNRCCRSDFQLHEFLALEQKDPNFNHDRNLFWAAAAVVVGHW